MFDVPVTLDPYSRPKALFKALFPPKIILGFNLFSIDLLILIC
jgi:hypothetical protein